MAAISLSDNGLERIRRQDAAIEFATLGSGNHFIELQADEEGRLWLMVHSGSRALGQAIHRHYLARATPVGRGLRALDADSEVGAAYLHDAACARRFADASRRAMAVEVGQALATTVDGAVRWDSVITTDHNHVSREEHAVSTSKDVVIPRRSARARTARAAR